jgi:ribonuclease P protein component
VYSRGKKAASAHLAIRGYKPSELIGVRPRSKAVGDAKAPLIRQPSNSYQIKSVGSHLPALSSCFGISISKKVSKRAVVRNRIKRQLQAVIRQHLHHIEPGWQVVIVVRPSAVECEFDDFLRELEYLLKKLKILA